MLVGLVAEAEHGKTTVADYLVDKKGFTKISFASPLKEMLVTAGLCTEEEVYVKKTLRSRELLQKIGTEIFRKQIDPNFWIKITAQRLMGKIHIGDYVIDDIRFPNEAELIKKLDGTLVKIIRLNKDGTKYIAPNTDVTHDSEKNVAIIPGDFTLEAKTGEVENLVTGIQFIINGR